MALNSDQHGSVAPKYSIVLFLIYLIYELHNYVKNKDNEEDNNTKQKNTFFDTLDIEIEKSGYDDYSHVKALVVADICTTSIA